MDGDQSGLIPSSRLTIPRQPQRPEVAAANATVGETATANRDGGLLLPPETRDSEVLYPGENIRARGLWPVAPPLDLQRLRDRIWTEIKAA